MTSSDYRGWPKMFDGALTSVTKEKIDEISHASVTTSRRDCNKLESSACASGPTTATRPRPPFSFPSLIFRKHKSQNDVVQHLHPRRPDFESRLLFVREVVRAVELSDYYLLLVRGDQLHVLVQPPRILVRRKQTYLGVIHSKCAHGPSILNTVWPSKHVAPGFTNRFSPPRFLAEQESTHPFIFPHLGRKSLREVILPRKTILSDENHFQ
jgi:hypothetical protein